VGGAFGLDVLFCVSADASHPSQKKGINFVGFCSPFILSRAYNEKIVV
jgi:hypothetical protein